MWPITEELTGLLGASRQVRIHADLYLGPDRQTERFEVVSGRLTGTVDTLTQWTLDATLIADRPADLVTLLAWGAELFLQVGFTLPAEIVWVPVGVFRAETARWSPHSPEIQLTAADRGALLAAARFPFPWVVPSGARIQDAIGALVLDGLPEGIPHREYVDATPGWNYTTRQLVFDRDRAEAITELADAAAGTVYPDRLGRLIFAEPWANMPDPDVHVLPAGRWRIEQIESGLGEVHNGVVVTGSSTEPGALPPVTELVTYDAPGQPLNWNGPFGRRPRHFSSPLVAYPHQARAVGQALLDAALTPATRLTITTPYHPGIDPGDIVDLDGAPAGIGGQPLVRHVVQRIEAPPGAGAMTLHLGAPRPAPTEQPSGASEEGGAGA